MLFIKAMCSLLLDLPHPSSCEAERFLAETKQIASKVAHEIWEKPELAMIQKVSRQKRIEEKCWGFEKRFCFICLQHVFFFFVCLLFWKLVVNLHYHVSHGWKPLLCSNCLRRPGLRSLHISMRFARMMALHSMRTAPGRDGKERCSSDIPKWFRIRNNYFDVLYN